MKEEVGRQFGAVSAVMQVLHGEQQDCRGEDR